jgi:hypothetical protein
MKAPKKHQSIKLMLGLKLEKQQLKQFCHCKIVRDKAKLGYSNMAITNEPAAQKEAPINIGA